MDYLFELSEKKARAASLAFKRYLYDKIDWDNRLIAITGARGSGKTTLMLQRLKTVNENQQALYLSLDTLYFSENKLLSLVEDLLRKGLKFLFIDEVHKYPDWSIEIKNLYDNYPELKIVFTGSSVLELNKGQGDLSRRALFYKLETMSFREFLQLQHDLVLPVLSLEQILTEHRKIASDLTEKIKPYSYWDEYLSYGAYPFFREGKKSYHERIRQVITTVLENDLPSVSGLDYYGVLRIKKLLSIISHIVPFKPNIQELAQKVGTDRFTIYKYLDYLEKARMLNLLHHENQGIGALNKPEKIYMENTSLLFALSTNEKPEVGTLREIFFYSHVLPHHQVTYNGSGDFMIDHKYVFEIGGKNKTAKQIKEVSDSWLALDNIEIGIDKRIPLWLFGLI